MAVTRVSHSCLLIKLVPICSSVVTTLGLKRKAIMEHLHVQSLKINNMPALLGNLAAICVTALCCLALCLYFSKSFNFFVFKKSTSLKKNNIKTTDKEPD